MNKRKGDAEDLIRIFSEREKELECLYCVEGLVNKPDAEPGKVFQGIVDAVPGGWQHPEFCRARLVVGDRTYLSADFIESEWKMAADIVVRDVKAGEISVYYTQRMPDADEGPFLKEEKRLLTTIADRTANFILHQQTKRDAEVYRDLQRREQTGQWQVVLDLLRRTDRNFFENVSNRMLNQLCWNGVEAAERLRAEHTPAGADIGAARAGDDNIPIRLRAIDITDRLSDEIFRIASEHFSDEQVLAFLGKWIQDDKLKFLVNVDDRYLALADVIEAIRRYREIAAEGVDLSPATRKSVIVSLIRRFLSSQLAFINIAKNYIDIGDYFDFIDRIIYTAESQGRLGGKCAGLFLAKKIIRKSPDPDGYLGGVKMPKSWYITSDVLLGFLRYNNLEEIIEQKYKDINQVRLEYPNVIQSFKSGRFPPEIVNGLSMALDEFEGRPLIIRSSSLLEDSLGAAFSGKYKSLFIANQGSKQERLEALMDAIAEVYASTFGPDPIEYRSERGLLDFSEEMGIMIQEVVGTRVGDYFIPAFAGVAFSRNEFRWSPRIRREDGLIRIVPGLGTRAVDRISDDYPVLIAPGQPGLRVNVSPEEVVHYSPRMIDVVNLATNSFETIDLHEMIRRHGGEIPLITKMISIYDGQRLRKPVAMTADFEKDDFAVTFDGLIGDTPFVAQVDAILKLLESALGTPVDIEFAHDGKNFHLLQCRPQSGSEDSAPVPIPKDVHAERVVFTARRYVSNGRVPDISHIVYVDPAAYGELARREDLLAVGRAVGQLNKLLPKRQFILMGPGRWGSRGDIKLGVSVTYSDISNTSVLIEIARRKDSYMPELSFGTHFFQDLVERQIRYLPLYPDDDGIMFNERFLLDSANILPDLLPEFGRLAGVLRLIDVPRETGGLVLRVLMNAELSEALGMLAEPGTEISAAELQPAQAEKPADRFWAWRLRMAERVAAALDPERFGVAGFYVFGSTKNATAGIASDIDILVHFRGSEQQREMLLAWLEGWSRCLDEMNYLRTGYRTNGLLDVHLVTDEDIASKTSYAVKIDAVTDAARPLPMMKPA